MRRHDLARTVSVVALLLALFTAASAVAAPSGAQPAGKEKAAEPSGKGKAAEPSGKGKAAEPAGKDKAAEPTASATLSIPLFDDAFRRVPIARVEGEIVTLGEFVDALASTHEARGASAKASADHKVILQRLVNLRLLIVEARAMGLDETPEFKDDLAKFENLTWRSTLLAQVAEGAAPDPKQVDESVRERVKELKVRSLLFEKQEPAKALVATVKGGAKFDDAAKTAVTTKAAKAGEGEGGFIAVAKLVPAARQALAGVSVGGVSEPFEVKGGYNVLYVEDARFPENAAARAEATAQSLEQQQGRVVLAFYENLKKKWVKKYDEALLKRLDFQAKKPGFEALAKDRRPLVRLNGAPDLTVSDLAAGLQEMFFHGIDNAIKEKRINEKKKPVLDALLYKRLFDLEARERRVDRTYEYERSVEDHANQLLFGAFIEKVVIPGVKVPEARLKAYYDAHLSEYSSSTFYTLDSIGFVDVPKAEAALSRLQKGADFKWLKQNADGRLPDSEVNPDLVEKTLMESGIPVPLKKALAGSKSGDVRLYPTPEGPCYVIQVSSVVPPKTKPFAEVREVIGRKVFNDAVGEAIEEWAAKLRKGYAVETFVNSIGL